MWLVNMLTDQLWSTYILSGQDELQENLQITVMYLFNYSIYPYACGPHC